MLRYLLPGTRIGSSRLYYSTNALPKSLLELFQTPPQMNSTISVNGYVKSVRSLKRVSFVDLTDNSTHNSLMCVLSPEQSKSLKTGQSVRFTGNWIESKGSKQAFELKVDPSLENVQILGDVPQSYPLQKKLHSLQFLRSLPNLRWRTGYLSSILRLRSFMDFKLNEFFHTQGFFKTNPPIITGSDCEGAGELFQVESKSLLDSQELKKEQEKFFGKNAYLTVSGQLHLETLCASLGKVWCFSPTFRAEASDTNRHLSEFWMLEAEVPFVQNVHQVTQLAEDMIKFVVKDLVNDTNGMGTNVLDSQRSVENLEEIRTMLQKRWRSLYENEWNRITFSEAFQILRDSGKNFKAPLNFEDGLATEHEKWLAGEHFQGAVFVTDYPKQMKPFYMKQNEDGSTVACFDLLVPDMGEIMGGSLREHDHATLEREMLARGMKLEDMEWYTSLRQNATMPHGGFGLGFERLVCYLAGVDNVRDVVPFPRAHDECEA